MITIERMYRALYNRIMRYRWRLQLKSFGNKSVIFKPLRIYGSNIYIGNGCTIQYKSWIEGRPLTGEKKAEIRIGDGCIIGHFNEIYSTKSIILENNVLTADRVYISDNLHNYTNPALPIRNQPIEQIASVRIGEGSWLGVGVAVIGANVGKNCVIGANAVVTKDIPDYCVAVGIPARIVKRYNFDTRRWERTNPDGSFLKEI